MRSAPSILHFTPGEEIIRLAIKHAPARMLGYERFHKLSSYMHHVPVFYTLFSPLFQIIYGTNNLHGGYFETGEEEWQDAQHHLTSLLGKALGLSSRHNVLEVGCGLGGPSVWMAQEFGARLTGLNITAAQLRRCREHARVSGVADRVSFVRGDAHKMPFDDQSFDHIYALESMSHMPGKETVIGQAARCIRPGGRMGVIDACVGDLEALTHHPDFNFFNVTWGVRADEWIREGEIPRGFEKHGFKLIEERDLSPNLEPAPLVQAEFTRRNKGLVIELYGPDIYEWVIKALEVASVYIKARMFTYKLWVGEK